jgi:hypothetical protein
MKGVPGANAMAGYLVVQHGEQSQRYELPFAETRIGRDAANDIVLESKASSRFHAVVRWDGQRFVVEDAASRNGTYLNGARLSEPTALQDGDVLLIGGLVLVYESDETTDWTPTIAASRALRLDLAAARVWIGGQEVRLSALEYRALALLYERPGALVTKEALASQLWPEYGGATSDEALAQLVARLRHKLGDDGAAPRYLHTVRGLGYRLDRA